MKKILLAAVLALAFAHVVFAQNYTVQSISGRVEQERGSSRVVVNTGDVLSANTVIFTGIGASLVVREGDKTHTIPAARNGKISELAAFSGGVRISGNVARTDTAGITRTTGQIATASARASDAAAENDIAAE